MRYRFTEADHEKVRELRRVRGHIGHRFTDEDRRKAARVLYAQGGSGHRLTDEDRRKAAISRGGIGQGHRLKRVMDLRGFIKLVRTVAAWHILYPGYDPHEEPRLAFWFYRKRRHHLWRASYVPKPPRPDAAERRAARRQRKIDALKAWHLAGRPLKRLGGLSQDLEHSHR